MATIHPWINFNGNAQEALDFYKSVFGGEFASVVRFKDIAAAGPHVSDEDAEKIMRIVLPIGDGSMLIANDVPSSMGTVNERENRSKIEVMAASKEEANTLFAGLSAGGEVEVTMTDGPWGTYFGMFRDKFGIEWIIESPTT